jgi:hypothetical protein
MKTRTISAALAAILILCLAGCAASPIDILGLAVGALEIALPLIGPAAGVDAATVTAVEGYLSATSQAITQAGDILAGTGSDAQKTTAIISAFAGIAAPVVPAKYSALVTAVGQVAQYVAQFLTSLPAATTAGASHALKAADKTKVTSIQARAIAVRAKTAVR